LAALGVFMTTFDPLKLVPSWPNLVILTRWLDSLVTGGFNHATHGYKLPNHHISSPE